MTNLLGLRILLRVRGLGGFPSGVIVRCLVFFLHHNTAILAGTLDGSKGGRRGLVLRWWLPTSVSPVMDVNKWNDVVIYVPSTRFVASVAHYVQVYTNSSCPFFRVASSSTSSRHRVSVGYISVPKRGGWTYLTSYKSASVLLLSK